MSTEKFSQMEYEKALQGLDVAIRNEDDLVERDKLRRLARELAKKKAIAFANMLLDDGGSKGK